MAFLDGRVYQSLYRDDRLGFYKMTYSFFPFHTIINLNNLDFLSAFSFTFMRNMFWLPYLYGNISSDSNECLTI